MTAWLDSTPFSCNRIKPISWCMDQGGSLSQRRKRAAAILSGQKQQRSLSDIRPRGRSGGRPPGIKVGFSSETLQHAPACGPCQCLGIDTLLPCLQENSRAQKGTGGKRQAFSNDSHRARKNNSRATNRTVLNLQEHAAIPGNKEAYDSYSQLLDLKADAGRALEQQRTVQSAAGSLLESASELFDRLGDKAFDLLAALNTLMPDHTQFEAEATEFGHHMKTHFPWVTKAEKSKQEKTAKEAARQAQEQRRLDPCWQGFVAYMGSVHGWSEEQCASSAFGPEEPHIGEGVGYAFGFYDHALVCHAAWQLRTYGSIFVFGSWYIEHANKWWKQFMAGHTSCGGGHEGGENSIDRQPSSACTS